MSASTVPPINITNVLHAPSHQTSHLVSSSTGTPAPDMPSKSTLIERLNIPGTRDETVEEYCTWQKSQVKNPALKVEYEKAYDAITEEGMDLELIRREPPNAELPPMSADILTP